MCRLLIHGYQILKALPCSSCLQFLPLFLDTILINIELHSHKSTKYLWLGTNDLQKSYYREKKKIELHIKMNNFVRPILNIHHPQGEKNRTRVDPIVEGITQSEH